MKCPRCGAEYKDGFTKCSDCDVELIEESPEQRPDLRPRTVRTAAWTVGIVASLGLPLLLRPSFEEWYAHVMGLLFLYCAIENLYGYFRPDYYPSAEGREQVHAWKRTFGLGYYVLAKCSVLLLCGVFLLKPPESATGASWVLGAFAIHGTVSTYLYLVLRLGKCAANTLHKKMIRTYAIDAAICVFVVLLMAIGMLVLDPMPSDKHHVRLELSTPALDRRST